MPEDSFAHATQFLREHDRDRYLSTLALPAKERDGVTAILAFNADIAAIRIQVFPNDLPFLRHFEIPSSCAFMNKSVAIVHAMRAGNETAIK